jgi:TIR domain/WD domain, G-beta repeat
LRREDIGMSGGVFISYRREDSAASAGRIFDRVARRLGRKNVFFDVDNILLGVDFVERLTDSVGRCDVLIAVIGKDWVSAADGSASRRLDDPHDFVRVEIEAALARSISVIPVLVDGAIMPKREDLPESLHGLLRRQGIAIAHATFESDVARLTKALSLIDKELRQREAEEVQRLAREEEARRVADTARQTAEAEARRAEEKRVERVKEAERAAREERARQEAAEGARAEETRQKAEAEAAPRTEAERRAKESADAERAAPEERERRQAADASERPKQARPQAEAEMTGGAKAERGMPEAARKAERAAPTEPEKYSAERVLRADMARLTAEAGWNADEEHDARGPAQIDAARRAASAREIAELRGHDREVSSAAFSPDGTRIVTASADKTARIWDAASGREITKLMEPGAWVISSAAFSPDGTKVLTCSNDGAQIWDPGLRLAVITFRHPRADGWRNWLGFSGAHNCGVFSPDGRRVAASFTDKTPRIWDATWRREIAVLRGHTNWVWSLAFSPDGKQIVTASFDKTARTWDAASGREIGALKGHEGYVRSAAFSPDGTRIVTASGDKTARIWDAASGHEIGALKGHEDWVNSVAFSPDGTRIVTASNDETARLRDASVLAQ